MLLPQSGPQPYKGRVCSLHEEIELSVAIPCLGSQMIMVKLGIEPSSVCVHNSTPFPRSHSGSLESNVLSGYQDMNPLKL